MKRYSFARSALSCVIMIGMQVSPAYAQQRRRRPASAQARTRRPVRPRAAQPQAPQPQTPRPVQREVPVAAAAPVVGQVTPAEVLQEPLSQEAERTVAQRVADRLKVSYRDARFLVEYVRMRAQRKPVTLEQTARAKRIAKRAGIAMGIVITVVAGITAYVMRDQLKARGSDFIRRRGRVGMSEDAARAAAAAAAATPGAAPGGGSAAAAAAVEPAPAADAVSVEVGVAFSAGTKMGEGPGSRLEGEIGGLEWIWGTQTPADISGYTGNEDRYEIDSESGIFGIYDGHGTHAASSFLWKNLITLINRQSGSPEDRLTNAFQAARDDLVRLEEDPEGFENFLREEIARPFQGKKHFRLLLLEQGKVHAVPEAGGASQTVHGQFAGSESTAVVAIIRDGRVYVANVGDTDAVRVQDDHEESLFLNDADNNARRGGGVYGLEYQGARDGGKDRGAFSTSKDSPFYLPFFYEYELTDEDIGLVLASDGVWDVLSAADVAQKVRDNSSAQAAAEDIQAAAERSQDDITVIVLKFDTGGDTGAGVGFGAGAGVPAGSAAAAAAAGGAGAAGWGAEDRSAAAAAAGGAAGAGAGAAGAEAGRKSKSVFLKITDRARKGLGEPTLTVDIGDFYGRNIASMLSEIAKIINEDYLSEGNEVTPAQLQMKVSGDTLSFTDIYNEELDREISRAIHILVVIRAEEDEAFYEDTGFSRPGSLTKAAR